MSEEKPTDPPKKKQGRPKGSKSKPKESKIEEIKPEEPKVEAKPEEPKEEPKVEAKPEEPKEVSAEKKEETALEKTEEKPKPKEYTPEEIEEIAKKVETPSDQTPAYRPEHILSQEYEGSTNYEQAIRQVREETEAKLARLRDDPNADILELKKAEEDLMILDSLHENYNIGMNVFRTAKGGRNKLRE
ncbi:MAG: hypothetical protein V3V69_01865 [Nitrosopumilaceae archaeon]